MTDVNPSWSTSDLAEALGEPRRIRDGHGGYTASSGPVSAWLRAFYRTLGHATRGGSLIEWTWPEAATALIVHGLGINQSGYNSDQTKTDQAIIGLIRSWTINHTAPDTTFLIVERFGPSLTAVAGPGYDDACERLADHMFNLPRMIRRGPRLHTIVDLPATLAILQRPTAGATHEGA